MTVAAALTLALVAVGCSDTDAELAELPDEVPGAGPTTTVPIGTDVPPCDGEPGVGGTPPEGAQPGDLVDSHLLDAEFAGTDGFPTDASVWRVLYVSTGVDEDDLQLVCGTVAAPAGGPDTFGADDDTGRLLTWSHGTIGLQQACQPSVDPATGFWGEMPGGINAIGWSDGLDHYSGDPANGALQTALDRGWVVAATDYQPNDTYIVGRIAAANAIDAARAATQLVAGEHPGAPARYDTISWGHSQGGHSAIWTGQLFDEYRAAAPNDGTAELVLRGVAAEAPATNLVADPDLQPGVEFGDGLADWEMHNSAEIVGLPIAALELQFGPALFSYIFGSWSELSQRGAPSDEARTPAFPPDAAELDLSAAATDQGATTIAEVMPLCVNSDARLLKAATDPYRDAATNRMLVEPLWNLPEDYSPGDFFKGGTDRTCATTDDAGLQQWCDWIRWNNPGPLGAHPMPKVPTSDGEPVPMLIAQGLDDTVIHCQPASDADADAAAELPGPADCMSRAYYDALVADGYCGPGGTHLHLGIFREDGHPSPAGHLTIPGQIAAAGLGASDEALTFTGSPLDEFMTGAFDGTLEPTCRAEILNPV